MANLTEHAAQLGMGTVVAGLKALERTVSKRKYKRLLSTAIAQLLILHPDLRPGQARRRAHKITGAKPSKKILVKPGQAGLKEGLETAAVAAASGAALKVAGKLGQKVASKVKESTEADKSHEQSARHA